MIDKFKPFFTDKVNIIFTPLEEVVSRHPIIIFESETEERNVYYLSLRSARLSNGTFKTNYKGEILVKGNIKGLPYKDSYVDTSTIFKINESELEKITDKNNILYLTTDIFNEKDILDILKSLKNNLELEPPFVSFIDVFKDNNTFKAKTLYSHIDKLNISLESKDINLDKDKFDLTNEIINNRNQNKNTLYDLFNLKLKVKEEIQDFIYSQNHLKEKEIIINKLQSLAKELEYERDE